MFTQRIKAFIAETVNRNRILAVLDQGLLNFYGFLYVILIVRPLSKEELGILMIADSVKFFFFALAEGCWGQAVMKYYAGAESKDKGEVLTTSTALKAAALLAGSLVIVVFAVPAANFMRAPGLEILLYLLPLVVAGKILYNTAREVMVAQLDYLRLFLFHCFHAVIFLGGIVTGLLWWKMDSALKVMLVFLTANTFSSLAAFPFLKGKWHWGRFDKKWSKDIFKFSRAAFINTTGSWLYWKTDILMIGAMLDPASAAVYGISSHFVKAFTLLSEAFNLLVLPAVAKISRNMEKIPKSAFDKIIDIYKRAGIVLQAMHIVLIGIFIAFAKSIIVLLFSAKYEAAAPVLQVLLFGLALTPFARLAGSVLTGIGKPQICAGITWTTGASNVVMNYFLIGMMGIMGAAVSSSVSMALMLVLYVYYIRQVGKTLVVNDE